MSSNARPFIETFSLIHAFVSGDGLVVNYTGRCASRELIGEFRAANNFLVRSFCTRVQLRTIKPTIFGRPKVGKSTFLGKIVHIDRALTGLVYVMCVDLALVRYLLM